ncbi:hypothetical protein CPB84DRAFT_1753978 [Gymnopilus junonius]|uniref:Uncharacterized protein n=1 Tax=Gymnopilus junonius TaxID=109634 RepID=A0A9P5N767_GYMJU|nr:hypothetical protein CPB84DRAFT_1753978 [Gymnopilus junonius]
MVRSRERNPVQPMAGPSIPQTQKRARADTQESTNEPSRGRKDTQRPNDDARTSQARRQRNAGAKKAGTARTAAHHRKRQRMTFEAPDNDDDVPDSTNDTVAGHADDEGNERGALRAASKPGVAKGSTRKGREIVEASEDDDGASGDDDGASGDNDGASGDDDGASEDNDGTSEDNEDNTTAPPPFTRHASDSWQVDKASTGRQASSRPPTHLDNPHLDVCTQREHSAAGRNVDPTHLSGRTGSKKKVGWVKESESEELGGMVRRKVAVVSRAAAQWRTKDKGKDKGKAKMPSVKGPATQHLTKTEQEIETSGISIAPPPHPLCSTRSTTSAHQQKGSQSHGHIQSHSSVSSQHRALSPTGSPQQRGHTSSSKQHRNDQLQKHDVTLVQQLSRSLSPMVTPPKSSKSKSKQKVKQTKGSRSKSHDQDIVVDEPVTPPHSHKRAISEFPPYTPDNLNEDVKMRSPPKQHIPAYGASRSTGGILRGHASGNVFNMADANQVWPDQSNTVDMVDRRKILLYHSADSPHNVKITHVKPLWRISVKDISECPTIKAVIKQAAKDSLPMQTNSKLFFYVYHNDEQDWTRYGTYTQVMAFAEDEDINAPWFRDPDGKNIVCVLATTFDIGTLFMAPSTTQPQSTSTHLHASTSSDANQESGLRTASASGNLSSDKERLIEYFGIPRHLIGTKNQGLRVNWEKYSACVTAINQAQHLYSAGKWPSNFPRYNQDLIIELIVGRSHWHGSYRLMRAVADHHPNMVHWLELEHSTPKEDKKAWGVSIPPITKIGWPELERYLRNHVNTANPPHALIAYIIIHIHIATVAQQVILQGQRAYEKINNGTELV